MFDLGGKSDLWSNFEKDFANIFDEIKYKDADGNVVFEIECPGFNKDNLTAEIAEGVLTVSGVRGEGERMKQILRRITVGSTESVEADITDGILKLTFIMPKEKSTKIEIK